MENSNSNLVIALLSILTSVISVWILSIHPQYQVEKTQQKLTKLLINIDFAISKIPIFNAYCIDSNGRKQDSVSHFAKPINNLNKRLDTLIKHINKQTKTP